MIRSIARGDLTICLDIIHEGYATVAEELRLPYGGRASLPYEDLVWQWESGAAMFGFFQEEMPVGFLSMRMGREKICRLDDLVVLPDYRGRGIGESLLRFCLQWAEERGAKEVRLGMIHEDERLRAWCERFGFEAVEERQDDGAPFAVDILRRGMGRNCGMCDLLERYARGEEEAKIVYESEHFLAVHSTKPFAEVHILIACKRHIPTIFDLGPTHDVLVLDWMRAIQAASREVIRLRGGCRLEMYLGEWQNTKHWHCHVVYDPSIQ